MINVTINGKNVTAMEGETIIEAARRNNITIPSLCYLKDVHHVGSCRICVVEVEEQKHCRPPDRTGPGGYGGAYKYSKGEKDQKTALRAHAVRSSEECLSCARNQNCEFQKLVK
jgi:NADH dehydrogenase/NADH:ubiquinone oxidoreductase subunit G